MRGEHGNPKIYIIKIDWHIMMSSGVIEHVSSIAINCAFIGSICL